MDNRYQLYINKVMELAKTIAIKSVAAANSINNRLVELYGPIAVNEGDPTTWKYYMNLAGEYHPSDKVMTVVSMDTLETIVFSKENFVIHRATARNYVYGTRQYDELVAQYPDQEGLILGILYPVNKQAAIDADDGAILGYPAHLVEANEYNFIPKLQAWIDDWRARWVVRGFTVTDSLYTATWMMILQVQIAMAMFNIRLMACKTNEAHSFFVKKYLASHGLNEDYLELLTLKQLLWLYRNIEYLQHHLGKQENLDLLIEHLMTQRNLPIAEYTMRHLVEEMPDNIYPELGFRKKTLNFNYPDYTPTIASLEQILDKQDQFARANQSLKKERMPKIKESMENADSNVLMTKFLESTVVDYGDGTPYTRINVLMHHWIYLASQDIYTAFITVYDPRTSEPVQLSVKDAAALACYAFAMAHGFEPIRVPQLIAERVQGLPTPSAEELRSVADPELVSLEDAQMLLARQPGIGNIVSTEAFYNTCEDIYKAQQLQRGLMALQEHPVKRAMMQNMSARIYGDQLCPLAPDETLYSIWLAERNLDLRNYTTADYQSMYEAIIQDATGLSLVAKTSIKSIQRAMVGLLSGLSSYSIQINAEVNGTDLIVLDTPMVRIGDVGVRLDNYVALEDVQATIQDATTKQKTTVHFDTKFLESKDVLKVTSHVGTIKQEVGLDMKLARGGVRNRMTYQIPFARLSLATPLPSNNRGIVVVPGIAEYLALTPEQQLEVIDMYDTGLPPNMPTSEYNDPDDIDNVLRQKILSGLTYDPDQQP